MGATLNRRTFSKIALGLGAASLPEARAQSQRKVKIGHTCITWVLMERSSAAGPGGARRGGGIQTVPEVIDQTVEEIAGLGFYGVEFFGQNLEAMEANGGLGRVLEKYRLPLISEYGGPNLTDPSQRKESIERVLGWAKILKKYGGKVVVLGPNSVPRNTYDFKANKDNIVTTLNECAKAVTDLGLTAALHQHTGTCVETRDETYAVMESVDTRYVKFGPDIGQLQKGGSDPVQVVKDFLPLVQHMHLKDFSGGADYLGYCPLGQGKVNIPAILDMMDGKTIAGMIMVELDPSPGMPLAPLDTAKIAKAYLQKQGVAFRT
jgi:inosose dehydratase